MRVHECIHTHTHAHTHANLGSALALGQARKAVFVKSNNGLDLFFLLVELEGGGWCISDADCLARSKTALGTNKGLKPTSPEPAGYCGSALLSA